MNEEQKNIETCLPENILSEVANVPTDPQFVSLTDEALDPLKQQALQQAGYDGYEKVVWTHKPYTFTSSVKQMKSNLILLLRRLWRFPFGRGTILSDAGSSASAAAPIRSLADMWQHYIHRLKGNPEYGIPSRLSQLTDLPSAPALLADRDMSSGIRLGENHLPDGMSLAQLLCTADSVTEIVDSNTGWVMKGAPYGNIGEGSLIHLFSAFSSAEKFTLHCKEKSGNIVAIHRTAKELYMPDITIANGRFDIRLPNGKVNIPNVEDINLEAGYDQGQSFPMAKEIYMPKLHRIYGYNRLWQIYDDPLPMEKIVFGSISQNVEKWQWGNGKADDLLHMEFGADGGVGLQVSTNLSWWTATNVLADADKTAQFLSNFKTYIAERLTDKGTGLTLTLSQEVRNAIHTAEDEYGIENIIITQKGWTISPAPN